MSSSAQKLETDKGDSQMAGRPQGVMDRLIVHQFDPARSSPGGIDTCLRGIAKYAASGHRLAFVGVDTGVPHPGRKLGNWEVHDLGGGPFYFLPVARLDPADQRRRIPHSLRLMAGISRFRRQLPKAKLVQAHRMDTALALKGLVRAEQAYFIHTQENGLTGKTSDSFWKRAASVHQSLEKFVVGRASKVAVFNEEYSAVVREWNPRARFSPTWFDPDIVFNSDERRTRQIVWVGRLEVPKDPHLALMVMDELRKLEPSENWQLDVLGSGSLADDLQAAADALPNVRLRGRVEPKDVAQTMATASTFLMTSHPGYEGYPRVLVEAMASGLVPVVTLGSDTGSLVESGVTGYVTSRDPEQIASLIVESASIGREAVRLRVADLAAPNVVRRLFETEGVDA